MSCGNASCGKGCGAGKIAKILVLVGALNWGVYGVSYFLGGSINVVELILGSWPAVEAIVYVLVGIAAIVKIFGCPCGSCKSACTTCGVATEVPKM